MFTSKINLHPIKKNSIENVIVKLASAVDIEFVTIMCVLRRSQPLHCLFTTTISRLPAATS